MIENLPFHIGATFILTTFAAIGFLVYAVRQRVLRTAGARIVLTLIPFWLFFTSTLALGGFYENSRSVPPRIAAFGVFPALLLISLLFVFFRESFIDRLPLKVLTLLSIVRIPVEIVLLWLFQNGQVPRIMTFEGRNFDILAGIFAPVVFWLAFRAGTINRPLLIGWNIAALLLLLNIAATAAFSVPSPLQQFGFDQPNVAVVHFPFVWLPAIVVPIVLFSHLASLSQLLFSQTPSETRDSS